MLLFQSSFTSWAESAALFAVHVIWPCCCFAVEKISEIDIERANDSFRFPPISYKWLTCWRFGCFQPADWKKPCSGFNFQSVQHNWIKPMSSQSAFFSNRPLKFKMLAHQRLEAIWRIKRIPCQLISYCQNRLRSSCDNATFINLMEIGKKNVIVLKYSNFMSGKGMKAHL